MGWLSSIRRTLFSLGGSTYDAVHAKNKRQAPTGILRSEDSELPPTERRKLLSATRTLHRNFSVAAWMIRTQSSTSSFPCEPNIMAPRQCVLTRTPVPPSVRYSMGASLDRRKSR